MITTYSIVDALMANGTRNAFNRLTLLGVLRVDIAKSRFACCCLMVMCTIDHCKAPVMDILVELDLKIVNGDLQGRTGLD